MFEAARNAMRPGCMFAEDVRVALVRAGLYVSADWWGLQAKRVNLHQLLGLTPEQSALELEPFALAAMRPRCDPVRELGRARRLCAERLRAARERGELNGEAVR